MSYARFLSTTCCENCGTECHAEELHGDCDGLCVGCGETELAKRAAEDAADFQWLSASWFNRGVMRKTVCELVDEAWEAEQAVA